jgi:hypothetical protein
LTGRGVAVPSGRRGGITHEYWRWVIAERLRQHGFQVESEAAIGGGRSIDLRATLDDRVLNIEVETGRSNISTNIMKCTALDGIVIFFFVNPPDAEEYRAVLQAMGAVVVTPDTIGLLDAI